MPVQNTIEHSGFINEIDDRGVLVRFVSESACASCHAKGVCSAADLKDKEVYIQGNYHNYKKGEPVRILMKLSQGSRAVLFGYVYPLIAFILILLILNSTEMPELNAGLYALSVLIPYYLILYLFRNKVNKKFSFSIRKYE